MRRSLQKCLRLPLGGKADGSLTRQSDYVVKSFPEGGSLQKESKAQGPVGKAGGWSGQAVSFEPGNMLQSQRPRAACQGKQIKYSRKVLYGFNYIENLKECVYACNELTA